MRVCARLQLRVLPAAAVLLAATMLLGPAGAQLVWRDDAPCAQGKPAEPQGGLQYVRAHCKIQRTSAAPEDKLQCSENVDRFPLQCINTTASSPTAAPDKLPSLVIISVSNAPLLPANALALPGLLVQVPNLRELQVIGTPVNALAADLLEPVPQLTTLNIYLNVITALPPTLFASARTSNSSSPALQSLSTVDFSSNLLQQLEAAPCAGLTASDPHLLQGLTNLQNLYLESNLITEVCRGSLAGLTELVQMDLSGNALSTLPDSGLADLGKLKFLYLENNQLTALPRLGLAGLGALGYLALEDNSLTQIADYAFADLAVLETLRLQGNRLRRLDRLTLAGLTRLSELFVRSNELQEIADFAFVHTPLLETLNARINNLTQLTANTLAGLTKLRDLSLFTNHITSIPAGTFAGLAALQMLLLNDNHITSVGDGAFPASLELLWMHANRLTRIGKAFINLPALQTLTLESNPITAIDAASDSLAGLPQLETLDLSSLAIRSKLTSSPIVDLPNLRTLLFRNNPLTSLTSALLGAGLTNLVTIDLTNNNISLVEARTAEQLPKLQQLLMAGNPSVCAAYPQSISPWSFWHRANCTCAPGFAGYGDFCMPVDQLPCPAGSVPNANASQPGQPACLPCTAPGLYVPFASSSPDCSAYACPAGTLDSDGDASTPCVACPANTYVPAGSSINDTGAANGCDSDMFHCRGATVDHDQDSSTPCKPLCDVCTCELRTRSDFDADIGFGFAASFVADCTGRGLSEIPRDITDVRVAAFGLFWYVNSVVLTRNAITAVPLETLRELPPYVYLLDLSHNDIREWPREVIDWLGPDPGLANRPTGSGVKLLSSFNPSECTSGFNTLARCFCAARHQGDTHSCVPLELERSACPAGWTDHDSNPATRCLLCSSGFYSPAGSFGACIACEQGTTDDDKSSATPCVECPAGSYTSLASTGPCSLHKCAAGTTDHDLDSETFCQDCPPGSYTPVGSFGSCSLFLCPAGYSDTDQDASTACETCDPGTHAPRGSYGQCATLGCPAGSTDADSVSATPCTVCDPGHYVPEGSAGVCGLYACPAGATDHDRDPSTPCVVCNNTADGPRGFFVPQRAAGNCSSFACGLDQYDADGDPSTPCQTILTATASGGSDGSSLGMVLALSIVGGLLLVGLLVVAVVMARKRRREHRENEELRQYVQRLTTRVRREFESMVTDESVTDSEVTLQALLTDQSNIVLGRELGRGAFGVVYAGQLLDKRSNQSTPVAVKQLLSNDEEEEGKFLLEGRLLVFLHHPRIVEIRGMCVSSKPFMLVTELLKGNLRELLCEYRRNQGERTEVWSVRDLLECIINIADAMCFLERKHVVHRDLAARNILVGNAGITDVKLADFGLSRSLEEKEYYRKTTDEKVPIKWMAPESIRDRKYSAKSDVWSFGVTAWEVFSFGKTPYASMSAVECMMNVMIGHRLPQPKDCPRRIYNEMKHCWTLNVDARPTFAAVHRSLLGILHSEAPNSHGDGYDLSSSFSRKFSALDPDGGDSHGTSTTSAGEHRPLTNVYHGSRESVPVVVTEVVDSAHGAPGSRLNAYEEPGDNTGDTLGSGYVDLLGAPAASNSVLPGPLQRTLSASLMSINSTVAPMSDDDVLPGALPEPPVAPPRSSSLGLPAGQSARLPQAVGKAQDDVVHMYSGDYHSGAAEYNDIEDVFRENSIEINYV